MFGLVILKTLLRNIIFGHNFFFAVSLFTFSSSPIIYVLSHLSCRTCSTFLQVKLSNVQTFHLLLHLPELLWYFYATQTRKNSYYQFHHMLLLAFLKFQLNNFIVRPRMFQIPAWYKENLRSNDQSYLSEDIYYSWILWKKVNLFFPWNGVWIIENVLYTCIYSKTIPI